MNDMIAHWLMLRAEAARCAMIKNAAMDQTKRELFALLAEQLGVLASEVERVITAKANCDNVS
jgi:hypothetical protein